MRMGGWCRRFDITVISLLSMSFELVLHNHAIRTLDIFNCIQCSDWFFFDRRQTMDDGRQVMAKAHTPSDGKSSHCLWQGELKI
jgi:hypothetical protein